MASIIEMLREKAVSNLFQTNTFSTSFPLWKTRISSLLGNNFTGRHVLDLGDNLSNIFRLTGQSSRSQSQVSGGGTAWESLLCWYMNLCLAGTRIVVIKQHRNLMPVPLKNAIQVNYGNFPSNTESDLVAIVFPEDEVFTDDFTNVEQSIQQQGVTTRGRANEVKLLEILNKLCESHIQNIEVGVIQCKTNWNDNAQIPMLWDMVYSSQGFGRNIRLGSNGFSISDLSNFTYSFVTVPTNQNVVYRPQSTAVQRVNNLSGGNFWGKPSQSAVASSVKEIFTRNFSNGISGSLVSHITNQTSSYSTTYSYFQL